MCVRCLSVAREGGVASSAFFLWCSPAGVKCRAPLIRVGEVRGPCPSVESVHESVGASGVLASAAKRARRSLIMAAWRAMARRLSSGVTLVSPLGCRTNGFPISKGALVTSLCHWVRFCARGAKSVKARGRSKYWRCQSFLPPPHCDTHSLGFLYLLSGRFTRR